MNAAALTSGVISLLGSLTYVGVILTLHVLPTGYSPVHDAVSDYGVGRYASLFRVGPWSGSISGLALTAGLAVGAGSPAAGRPGSGVLGTGNCQPHGESLFTTTLEGRRLSRSGPLRYVFAILTFGFTYAAISGLTAGLTRLHPWVEAAGLLRWLAGATLVGLILVVATLLPRLRNLFGLCERFFLLVTYGWLVLVAPLLIVRAA
jgi:Protein of unknown function (DUF998)